MDKYKNHRERVKKNFTDGYLTGARDRIAGATDSPTPDTPAYNDGYQKGYDDADQAIKKMEEKVR